MANLNGPNKNLVSNIMVHGSKDVFPEVGMGVTIPLWTDRHAGTIVAVDPGLRWVDVQEDNAIRTDTNGMSDHQEYRYERRPGAATERYTKRQDGCWVRKGESMRNGQHLIIGHRSAFHDFTY